MARERLDERVDPVRVAREAAKHAVDQIEISLLNAQYADNAECEITLDKHPDGVTCSVQAVAWLTVECIENSGRICAMLLAHYDEAVRNNGHCLVCKRPMTECWKLQRF